MDFGFFKELLSIDSTSGKERKVAEWLVERLPEMFPAANRPVLRVDEVGDGTLNLLLTWGSPRIVFCSHLDTVPPYIEPIFPEGVFLSEPSLRDPSQGKPWAPPSYVAEGGHRFGEEHPLRETVIKGRGSCDAKGQVFAIVEACKKLAEEGKTDFGMLLLAGEETGSWGAKAFAKTDFKAEYLVVGEPTDNCMVSASKGTKSFDLKFTGEPFHSGYPQFGVSAVDLFVDFVNQLKAKDFGMDPVLGETTWNIGLLHSDNPQNILSPELTCRIYFRTTFVSDEAVCQWMEDAPGLTGNLTVTPRGGDTPAQYWTVPGLPSKSVAFGSDAPHLTNFTHKAICGPGSITVAHRDDEHVLLADLETAVEQYLKLYSAAISTAENTK
jgi:Acetylornithine deacetylase/Succinyl-diaminopimelate desuccinylase and related deacylases